MQTDRRVIIAAITGAVLVVVAGASDFLAGSFWERHALFASLVANLLVVAVTVAVVNEFLERRDRRRWSLLAQSVLFELVQGARTTWTGLLEVLRLAEVRGGSLEHLAQAAMIARDRERLSGATRTLLADPARRETLQRVSGVLRDHESSVIARWAPVMVSARPYAETLDRHVELAVRLGWLNSVLATNEPVEGMSFRDQKLARSSVGAEHADELGDDDWLHDQLIAVITLATELDYDSREQAFSIVSTEWWAERPVPHRPGRLLPSDAAQAWHVLGPTGRVNRLVRHLQRKEP